MKKYHAPNSGISAYAEGKDHIIIQFKTGERYRYDSSKPGRRHVAEMKSRARRTSGLTTYINQHVRDNYAAKLGPGETSSPQKRIGRSSPPVSSAARKGKRNNSIVRSAAARAKPRARRSRQRKQSAQRR